ncbi:hypothetical protein SAMN05421768_104272 [Chryseobacterium joostei]|uniref:Uncharacterized protein n=1 Tax=Chryseobacterium joostei TaxID=112234 RepID=A0A1N7IDS1_9FLAO|nr:hypothetical protein SAMN05421768_104272 [Chryseobacterium joostei]
MKAASVFEAAFFMRNLFILGYYKEGKIWNQLTLIS